MIQRNNKTIMQNHKEEKTLCFVCKGRGTETHRYMRNDGVEVEEILECSACGGAGEIRQKATHLPPPTVICIEKPNSIYESLQIEETDI